MMRPKEILLCASLICAVGVSPLRSSDVDYWMPPWIDQEVLSVSKHDRVAFSSAPFVFKCYISEAFDGLHEAESFAQGVEVLSIDEFDDNVFRVAYADHVSLKSLVAPEEINAWANPYAQFALFESLRRIYHASDYIRDGRYYRVGVVTVDHDDPRKAIAGAELRNRRIMDVSDTLSLEVFDIHYPHDLIGDAERVYRGIQFYYDHYVTGDDVAYEATSFEFRTGYRQEVFWVPGGYSKVFLRVPDQRLGAYVDFFAPEEPDPKIEHHVLRELVLQEEDIEVVEYFPGQFVYQNARRQNGMWPTENGNYVFFKTNHPEIVGDMLAKHPSRLTEDSEFDRERWAKDEVTMLVQEMKRVTQEYSGSEQTVRYMSAYAFLNRLMGTVGGAPLFSFTTELSQVDLLYHYSMVESWWQGGEAVVKLREEFLSHNSSLRGPVFGKLDYYERQTYLEEYKKTALKWAEENGISGEGE